MTRYQFQHTDRKDLNGSSAANPPQERDHSGQQQNIAHIQEIHVKRHWLHPSTIKLHMLKYERHPSKKKEEA